MPSAAIPLLDLNASALSVVIHARQVSCRESLAATLARIDQLNPRFNAIVSRVDGDAVMAQADICNCELAVGQSRGAGEPGLDARFSHGDQGPGGHRQRCAGTSLRFCVSR